MDTGPSATCDDGFANLAPFESRAVADEVAFPVDCKDDCGERLHRAGLRPTRQRVMLGGLLFANGDRHVTAETLF